MRSSQDTEVLAQYMRLPFQSVLTAPRTTRSGPLREGRMLAQHATAIWGPRRRYASITNTLSPVSSSIDDLLGTRV